MKKKAISITVFIMLMVGLFIGLHKTVHAQAPKSDNITLVLNREDVQYIINILADKPFKESAGLINSIITQASVHPQKDTTVKAVDAVPKKKK